MSRVPAAGPRATHASLRVARPDRVSRCHVWMTRGSAGRTRSASGALLELALDGLGAGELPHAPDRGRAGHRQDPAAARRCTPRRATTGTCPRWPRSRVRDERGVRDGGRRARTTTSAAWTPTAWCSPWRRARSGARGGVPLAHRPRRRRSPAPSKPSASRRTSRCAACSSTSPPTDRSSSPSDDVQWADPASVELARPAAAPAAARAGVARIRPPRGTRPPPPSPAASIAPDREGFGARIELGPLTAGRGRRAAWGGTGESARAILLRESGGNPFLPRAARA